MTGAGQWTDVGTLGGTTTYPYGINNRGQVVGSSSTASGGSHAFVWTSETGIVDLGTLGGRTSVAYGINNQGQVVGESDITGNAASHAFLYSPGTGMRDLGTLGGTNSVAKAITDLGYVVGGSDTNNSAHIAFQWSAAVGMSSLPPGGMTFSEAEAVSSGDQAVGQASNGPYINAYSWSSANFEAGGFLVGGVQSVAQGVNDAGQIVGTYSTGMLAPHAFVKAPGEMVMDLGIASGGLAIARRRGLTTLAKSSGMRSPPRHSLTR